MTWQLHSGSGAPGSIPGQTDGDNYINTDTGGVYQLVGTTWILRAVFPGLYTTAPGDPAKFWRGDASWAVPPGGSGGDVSGPSSATGDNFASFDGATGKIIKDSGYKPADFAVAAKGVTNGDSHDHVGGDGAAITESALSLSDVTTGDASTDKHGFESKAPNDLTKLRIGDASWKFFGGLASITSAVAIANTETVVVSKTLPANTMRAGTTFRISFSGVGTTGATPGTSEFRIRIGSVTLTGNVPTSYNVANAANKTGYLFKGEALVVIRSDGASGKTIGTITIFTDSVYQLFTYLISISTGSPVDVDTTAEKIIELTYKSGNAGTTLTFSTAIIEIVKI